MELLYCVVRYLLSCDGSFAVRCPMPHLGMRYGRQSGMISRGVMTLKWCLILSRSLCQFAASYPIVQPLYYSVILATSVSLCQSLCLGMPSSNTCRFVCKINSRLFCPSSSAAASSLLINMSSALCTLIIIRHPLSPSAISHSASVISRSLPYHILCSLFRLISHPLPPIFCPSHSPSSFPEP